MTTLLNMPEDWPGDWCRDSTAECYPGDELFFSVPINQGSILQRPRKEAASLSPISRSQLPNSGLRLRTTREALENRKSGEQENQTPFLYSTFSNITDELFLPRASLPLNQQTSPLSLVSPITVNALFLPQSRYTSPTATNSNATSTLPQEFSVPRPSLRVDTATIQAMAQKTSPLQPASRIRNPLSCNNGDFSAIEKQVWSEPRAGQHNLDLVSPMSPTSNIVESPLNLVGNQNGLFSDFSPLPVSQPGPKAAVQRTELTESPLLLSPAEIQVAKMDFMKYEPPVELQSLQNGTPVEIESILEPSIMRVRRRHEEAKREAVIRSAVLQGQLPRVKPLKKKTVSNVNP